MSARPLVGTLGEKPLHAALKRWYAEDADRIEEPVDGFVIDLVRNGLLIEIQTRGFSSMKHKRLLPGFILGQRVDHCVPFSQSFGRSAILRIGTNVRFLYVPVARLGPVVNSSGTLSVRTWLLTRLPHTHEQPTN